MRTESIHTNMNANSLPMGLMRIRYENKKAELIYANKYYFDLFGLSEDEFYMQRPDEYGLQNVFDADFPAGFDNLELGDIIHFYIKGRAPDGQVIYVGVNAMLAERDGGTCVFDACSYAATWLIHRLTNYDNLTSLPKIHTLHAIFHEEMKKAADGDLYSIVSIDVNNFKLINEKIGQDSGDKLLIRLALEIKNHLKGKGAACRAFSDKYVYYFKVRENMDAKALTEAFIDDFTKKMRIEYENCNISISAGIYFVTTPDNSGLPAFIDKANIARQNAKAEQNGQENFCLVYEEKMKDELDRSMQITWEAVRAIQNKEFIVYYQPKISLKKNAVAGAEALVRWQKPDGALIPPGLFIPYLEKSSFIKEVDFYVYEAVCAHIRDALKQGEKILPVSVNVSRLHLKDEDFIEKVIKLVKKYAVPPEYLEFELTENAFLDDEQRAIQILRDLRNNGFLVSIDDFGSGYSSLNLLKELPVDILKLDRAFFGMNDLKENNAIVVSSIINMANQMNISVICEGVETREQVEFLKNTECDSVQGFFFAKPISKDEFDEFKINFNTATERK